MTHQPSPIAPKPASGPGALDGFVSTCTCGLVMSSSLLSILQIDVYKHVEYHANKEVAR